MLAQNFKTAKELNVSEQEHAALIDVLGRLERGELKHCTENFFEESYGNYFNMNYTYLCKQSSCGTMGCIGGWVGVLLGVEPTDYVYAHEGEEGYEDTSLADLYFPRDTRGVMLPLDGITAELAAIALRNKLTTGKANWLEVLGEKSR
jgi:hypothetical protein